MIHMRKRSLYIRLRNLELALPPYKKTTFRELCRICVQQDVHPDVWSDLIDANDDR